MRPRKPVLLYCPTLDRLATWSFILETRCAWARITATNSLKTAESLSGNNFDCIVLVDGPGVERLISHFDPARVILATKMQWFYRVTLAGRKAHELDIAALLDAMKTVSTRKRGPKKHVEYLVEAS